VLELSAGIFYGLSKLCELKDYDLFSSGLASSGRIIFKLLAKFRIFPHDALARANFISSYDLLSGSDVRLSNISFLVLISCYFSIYNRFGKTIIPYLPRYLNF
jgi:hypothetical protein